MFENRALGRTRNRNVKKMQKEDFIICIFHQILKERSNQGERKDERRNTHGRDEKREILERTSFGRSRLNGAD
jgi:hypothetical protein